MRLESGASAADNPMEKEMTMHMRQMLLALSGAAVLLASGPTWAADARNCKDPAMFPNRIPNYAIVSCKTSNDAENFRWPGGQQQALGVRTEVVYRVPSPADGATPKYIATNYANAVSKIGGKLLDDPTRSTLGDRLTARVNIEGKEVWVHLSSDNAVIGGNWSTYKVVVLQQDAAAQVISAQKMLDELNSAGFITLYINFETAKWDIKPESRPTVDEIATLLRNNPALKVSIEGHTDNVGTPAANKTLSENRARSVMQALVAAGTAGSRLKSAGYGQERPIADNRTEEGRAKNRRVELVKF